MKSIALTLLALCLAALPAGAQFQRRVTVSGLSTAGTSFTLDITNTSLTRSIPFGPLATDYTATAMAGLMIAGINADYKSHGYTGFIAYALTKADGRSELESTFVIQSDFEITDIAIGPPGGGASAPRAPGIAFNPNFIDQQSDVGTPYLGDQVGHPNANLTLNGVDPSVNHFRRVEVLLSPLTGGGLDLAISGLPNMPILLAGGSYADGITQSPNGVFALYFGTTDQQTWDIGTPNPVPGGLPLNTFIVADGIFGGSSNPGLDAFFHTDGAGNFVFPTFPIPVSADGFSGDGFQAILPDPSLPAPHLRFTQAAHPVYRIGRERQFLTSSDGFSLVDFLPGQTFDFYGVTAATQVNVFENGLMTFGNQMPTLGGATVDVLNQLGGDPAIYVNWADWAFASMGPTPLDGIRVYEFGDEIRFAWGGGPLPFGHANDGDSAFFECVLRLTDPVAPRPDAGAIRFDFVALDPASVSANDSVIGVSPGGLTTVTPPNLDLGLSRITPVAGAPLLEQSFASSFAASVLPTASGVLPQYSNGSGWSGRILDVFPPVGTGPLPDRHVSIASDTRPDDFRAVRSGFDQISAAGGAGQSLELVGWFRYAFDFASLPQVAVVLDATGQFFNPTPLNLTAVGQGPENLLGPTVPVFLPAPGFRSYEQVQVSVPDPASFLPVGLALPIAVDIDVVFADGTTIRVPGGVTINP
ncbi:MAG: hypothetical protein R3F20_14420 [Planctomycetota bacterium]